MSYSINRVEILGRLGKDPEIRKTHDGTRVANFTIATTKTWKDKASGEKKEKTAWHRVTIWGGGVEIAEKFLKKGSRALVVGELENHEYEKDGRKHFSTEIVVQGYGGEIILLDKLDAATAPRPAASANSQTSKDRFQAEFDDEVQF